MIDADVCEWVVGDVARHELIDCRDLAGINQAGKALDGPSESVVRGGWPIACNPKWSKRFGTRSWLIGIPSLARSSTIWRLPLEGCSKERSAVLAMIPSIKSSTAVDRV